MYAHATTTNWMQGWVAHFYRKANDMGYTWAKPAADNWLKKHLLPQILDPAHGHPHLVAAEAEPVRYGSNSSCNGNFSGKNFMDNWGQVIQGFSATALGYRDFSYATVSGDAGYDNYALAAASLLPGLTATAADGRTILDGTAAWLWMKANVTNARYTRVIPRLGIVPRVDIPSTGPITAPVTNPCDLDGDRTVNTLDLDAVKGQVLRSECSSGDVNRDGACNVVDMQLVLNAMAGRGCTTN
jgi:hypothetical protein